MIRLRTLALILAAACGNGSARQPQKPPPPAGARSLKASSTSPGAGEIVLLDDAAASFAEDLKIAGTFNGTAVVISRVDAHRLGFLVPFTASGTAALVVMADVTYAPVTLSVQALAPPSDPVASVTAALQSATASLDGIISSPATTPATATTAAAAKRVLADFSVAFAKYDPAAQLRVAMLFKANPSLFGNVTVSPSREWKIGTWAGFQLVTAWATVAASIGVTVVGVATLQPEIVYGGIVAMNLAAANLQATQDQCLNQVFAPADQAGDADVSSNAAPSPNVETSLVFHDGQPLSFPMKMKLRNVNRADVGTSDPVLGSVVSAWLGAQAVWPGLSGQQKYAWGAMTALADVAPVVRSVPIEGPDVTPAGATNGLQVISFASGPGTATATLHDPACPHSTPAPFGLNVSFADGIFPAVPSTLLARLCCGPDDCTVCHCPINGTSCPNNDPGQCCQPARAVPAAAPGSACGSGGPVSCSPAAYCCPSGSTCCNGCISASQYGQEVYCNNSAMPCYVGSDCVSYHSTVYACPTGQRFVSNAGQPQCCQ